MAHLLGILVEMNVELHGYGNVIGKRGEGGDEGKSFQIGCESPTLFAPVTNIVDASFSCW